MKISLYLSFDEVAALVDALSHRDMTHAKQNHLDAHRSVTVKLLTEINQIQILE